MTAVGPLLWWLAIGAPDPALVGNSLLLALGGIFMWSMIWHQTLMRLLRADTYTYSMVSTALNKLIGTVALVGISMTFAVWGRHIETAGSLPNWLWATGLATLLLSWYLPLATAGAADSLPRESERRHFEDPTNHT